MIVVSVFLSKPYLVNILQHLIKQNKAHQETANKLGKLINLDFLEEVKTNGKTEHEELIQWLQKIKFLRQENSYKTINKLLNINSEDNEEKLLFTFAPNDYLLNDKYDEYGLAFFLACRQEEQKLSKNINADLLIEWINNISEDSDESQKVIDYVLNLKHGQFKTDLVDELCEQFDWIKKRTQLGDTTSNTETKTETESLEGDEDDSVIDPQKAKEYGEIGEKKAVEFYKRYYQRVNNLNDTNPENPGFDLECFEPQSPDIDLEEEIKVEVKAITYNRPYIRITLTEWDLMIENKDNYELFIYAHDKGEPKKLIRIKKVWLTIKKSLESLQQQKLSHRLYGSKKIESVIGLQQNSQGSKNEILLNWHRLFRDFNDENIEKC